MEGKLEREEASSNEECDLENQPFLQADDPSSSNEAKVNDRRKPVAVTTDRRLIFMFLIVFVVAVVFLLLAVVSWLHPDIFAVVGGHNEPVSNENTGIVAYDEEIPAAPQLRHPDEYILSASWDINEPPRWREYNWTISDAVLNPDGVFRPMILINNQFPGPLVECNEGDTITVHVSNQAKNATAIHFHGMYQNGTNHMDGTVGITQCPIAPNSSFTYTFTVQGQSGTYWYHAHHSAQASDGLLGPMVVHSPDERDLQKLDYATDRIVMVQDHYHNLTSELLMDYLASDGENDEPVPDNALINGRGTRDCADFEGWPCDTTNVSIPTLNLAAGKRHRLRIINVGAFAEFQIQFDEHPFYVTEVDGTDVHPEPFHRLNILPAQRYSVVLEANSTTSSAFWMRARMVAHCFTSENEHLQPEMKAIIRYDSDEESKSLQEPLSKDWSDAIEVICRDLNTTELRPVVPISPPPADDFIVLRANFMIGAWRLARGFFNESTWHGNLTSPSLHRVLDAEIETPLSQGVSINQQIFDPSNDFVIQTNGIRTVDISINNFDDGAHPFHLHGHKFFVLMQGTSGYPPSPSELAEYMKNNEASNNPLRRDTMTVEGYAWAIVRVVLDNPGVWAFHCHNTWHAESGMVMQFLVRPEAMHDWKIEPEHRDLCKRKGVQSGMRPSDDLWFGNFN